MGDFLAIFIHSALVGASPSYGGALLVRGAGSMSGGATKSNCLSAFSFVCSPGAVVFHIDFSCEGTIGGVGVSGGTGGFLLGVSISESKLVRSNFLAGISDSGSEGNSRRSTATRGSNGERTADRVNGRSTLSIVLTLVLAHSGDTNTGLSSGVAFLVSLRCSTVSGSGVDED